MTRGNCVTLIASFTYIYIHIACPSVVFQLAKFEWGEPAFGNMAAV